MACFQNRFEMYLVVRLFSSAEIKRLSLSNYVLQVIFVNMKLVLSVMSVFVQQMAAEERPVSGACQEAAAPVSLRPDLAAHSRSLSGATPRRLLSAAAAAARIPDQELLCPHVCCALCVSECVLV